MSTKYEFIWGICDAIDADELTAERLFDEANERGYVECHWQYGYRWSDDAYAVYGTGTDEDEVNEVDVLLMHNRIMSQLADDLRDTVREFADTETPAVSLIYQELIIDGNRGIYVPQSFAIAYLGDGHAWDGISQNDIAVLRAGPYHSDYWDTWNNVEQRASLTNELGTWRLWRDDDLFVYREKTDESIAKEILDALRDTMVQEYIDKLGWNEAFQTFLSTCDFSHYACEAVDTTIQLDELLYTFVNEQAAH